MELMDISDHEVTGDHTRVSKSGRDGKTRLGWLERDFEDHTSALWLQWYTLNVLFVRQSWRQVYSKPPVSGDFILNDYANIGNIELNLIHFSIVTKPYNNNKLVK